MNQSAFAALVALAGCFEQKVVVISTNDIEARTRDPEAPYVRGSKQNGEECTQTLDCFSLSCVAGLCTAPCGGAPCQVGSSCEEFELAFSCDSHAACASAPGCPGRQCYCNNGACTVAPYCFEICKRDEVNGTSACGSPQTVCRPNFDLDNSVCVPRDFIPNLGNGTNGVGEECPTAKECDGARLGLECIGTPAGPGGPNYPRGYCTRACRGGDCPGGSVCVLGFCHQSCDPETLICSAQNAACLNVGGIPACVLNPELATPPDAGVAPDSGTAPDAGTTPDAGVAPDSGTTANDRAIGDECPIGNECASDLICGRSMFYPNNYCTYDCDVSQGVCPGGSYPIDFSEDGVIFHCLCAKLCSDPNDCPAAGSTCDDDGAGGPSVCL